MTQTREKIRFILNPKAGHGLGNTLRQAISTLFSDDAYDVELVTTTHAGHATELGRDAIGKGYNTVVAVGGDGTVNEVAQALAGSGTSLGIIPTGSGNGFARYFKIPAIPDQALSVIRNGRRFHADSMEVNGRFCINIAGAGFDAFIAGLFAMKRKRGVLTYMKLVIGRYFSYRPRQYSITFNGKTYEGPALLISFANGTQYGNDALIAPAADPGDGLLDLVILRKVPWYKVPAVLRRLYKGSLCAHPCMDCYRIRSAKLVSEEPMHVHADGEPLVPVGTLDVQLHPSTNWILVP